MAFYYHAQFICKNICYSMIHPFTFWLWNERHGFCPTWFTEMWALILCYSDWAEQGVKDQQWLNCGCCYGLSWFSTLFFATSCYPDRHDHKMRKENEEREVVHKREEVIRVTTHLWAGTVRVNGEQMSSAITSLLQFEIKRLVTLQTQQNMFIY